jgi:cation diffusion facilitator family transporter
MHTDSLDRWRHSHVFLGERHDRNERQTWLVIVLTCVMMVGEIAGGAVFGSMALLADGLHMSTHAGALLIAALAYRFARRHARSTRFAFGTGKVGDLAAFTSAIVLAMIALLIAVESVGRLLAPVPIGFAEALPIAVLGLAVNLLSAWLLRDDHEHEHEHDDGQAHHHDHNLRAAYVHVLADAATSVLAIVGLLLGWAYGWNFMDPMMGIVGALVIANWSYGLLRRAGAVLLDMTPDEHLATAIRETLEAGEDRVADLHLWRLGPGHFGAIVALVSHDPEPPAAYKRRLASLAGLSHVTIEVEHCA